MTNDDKALQAVKALAGADWGDERIHVGKHAAYLWCANGILESKALEALLKGLKGTGTTRNWATLNKIHALMGKALSQRRAVDSARRPVRRPDERPWTADHGHTPAKIRGVYFRPMSPGNDNQVDWTAATTPSGEGVVPSLSRQAKPRVYPRPSAMSWTRCWARTISRPSMPAATIPTTRPAGSSAADRVIPAAKLAGS